MLRPDRRNASDVAPAKRMDAFRAITVIVLVLLTLLFLFATIMPIVLFEALEDAAWEFKTFATANRPLVALLSLILFMVCGWLLLRVVRGPQAALPSLRRRTRRSPRPAAPAPMAKDAVTAVLGAPVSPTMPTEESSGDPVARVDRITSAGTAAENETPPQAGYGRRHRGRQKDGVPSRLRPGVENDGA